MALFTRTPGQYKSSIYETARGILRSRNNQARRAERLVEQNRSLQAENDRLRQELQQSKFQFQAIEAERDQLQEENQQLRERPLRFPSDLPLPHHSYGPQMMALCLNLCQKIGFRPAKTALEILFEFLGIEATIPSWSAIRVWLSTENLESSFGLLKGLENQHSKGGFTSLLAAMPMLLTGRPAAFARASRPSPSSKCKLGCERTWAPH